MKNWSYGINTYHWTASYSLEKGPWHAFLIERLIKRICSLIPHIPLPRIPIYDEENKEETNWREYYRNFAQLFHLKIHMPIFNWARDRIRLIVLNVPYDELKERHYEEDKRFFDEQEKEANELKQKSKK